MEGMPELIGSIAAVVAWLVLAFAIFMLDYHLWRHVRGRDEHESWLPGHPESPAAHRDPAEW